MAVPIDRTYFPPLEECLTGKAAILSWKSVASALEDISDGRLASSALCAFLTDPYVHELLKNPAQAFSPPTAQTKTNYETKTAAINVIPAPNDPYNISEIKADAKWLSDAVNVNEVAALRIAVLEYRSRPQSHLTGPLSSQDIVNIQEAAGVNDAQASSILALLNMASVEDAETAWAAFEAESGRRQRILGAYLSERRSFMSAADSIITFILHGSVGSLGVQVDTLRHLIARDGFGFDENNINVSVFEQLVPDYLRELERCSNCLQAGPNISNVDIWTEQLQIDWIRTALTEAIHAMSFVFQVLDLTGNAFASPEIVQLWFGPMEVLEFAEVAAGHELLAELATPLQALACAISLTLLNVERSIQYLDQDLDLGDAEDPYLASSDILTLVHTKVTTEAELGIAAASPVIFAWSLVLHRMFVAYQERAERRDLLTNQRAQDGFELENQPAGPRERRNSAGSIVSIEKSPYDLFLASQSLERDAHAAERMAHAVTDTGLAYDVISEWSSYLGTGQLCAFRPAVGIRMRNIFLRLLEVTFPMVLYKSANVSCLVSLLSAGRQYWDLAPESSLSATKEVTTSMLGNEKLMDQYFREARCRFPWEFEPFASLCRNLCTSPKREDGLCDVIPGILTHMPSITMDWKPHWVGYELVFEDENTNSFLLTEDIDLFTSSRVSRRRLPESERFTIPAGTVGRFCSEDAGRVAILDCQHSALALIGKRLATVDPYETELPLLAQDEVAEAIALLATLIRTGSLNNPQSDTANNVSSAMSILKEASSLLSKNKDIFAVVTDILDTLIQEDIASLDGPRIATISACLQFLDATLGIAAGRVWTYMTRCGLIHGESRASRLSRLTGSLDVFAERFGLLSSATKLFSNLVENARVTAVQRKTATTTNNRREMHGELWLDSPWLGTSDKLLSRVCLSIAQTAVDVFENSVTWRLPSELDRSILIHDVVDIMHKLLSSAFSMGTADAPNALMGSLAAAAKYIVDSFLSTSSSSLRFQPLLATLLVVFQIPDSTLYPRRSRIVSARLQSVLNFSTILLRVVNYLDKPPATLQTQLFKSASVVARLPAVRSEFKIPSINLLSALVESAGKAGGEPPSLLGYLSQHISRSFIQIVSRLDKPYDRMPDVLAMWRFFSIVMRNRQQWMANCLLTGKTPREAIKADSKTSTLSPDSVLTTTLEKIRAIDKTPSEEMMVVMDFFTSVQNYWPWTVFALQQEEAFLPSLRAYARNLKAPSVVIKSDAREAAYQARIAAYIAETFAMQLYHLRQTGQHETFANEVANDVDYFLRNGVEVADYNASLHANFAKNFSNRYSGCSIDDFKRTTLVARDIGPQYFYDLETAEALLSYDTAWVPRRGGNGFKYEMRAANLNLSLVEAEVALYHAWEYLLLELSVCLLPQNSTVARQMLQVAEQALESNQRSQPPEDIFVRLRYSRASLALTLFQRLADASQMPADISQSLTVIATTIYGVEDPFSKDQISYQRTLLKILFVVLRGARHSSNSAHVRRVAEAPAAVTQQVLTILERVVAASFRTLVTLIHESESVTTPEDLALVTAVLQACLSVPGIEQCQEQILNIMLAQDVIQMATSLFSWSDRFTYNGDPIYGELSLLFLLELSALRSIAEQLAIEGLLSHITSAKLVSYMRQGNVSPFSDNAGAARCYGVWAKGILPLLLNIIRALDAKVAPEVAHVLNQFDNLLNSSANRIQAPGISRTVARDSQQYITLIGVAETHSLALLFRVLAALRVNNQRDIPEVRWDAAGVLENVEFWLASRKILRERLLALGPRESDWRATKASEGSNCENRLEEKVVSQLEAVRDVLSEDLE